MKRLLTVLAILFLFQVSVMAQTFSEICQSAENVSSDARMARLEYQSRLIALEEAELEDRTDYSVSFSVSPLEDDNRIVAVPELSFSAVLPDDDTEMTASIPFSVRYDGEGALISPSASVSHVFDWGHDDEALKALQNASTRLSVSREHESAFLTLRMNVISAIAGLLENERSMMEEKENLRDLQRALETDLRLGNLSESSLLYVEEELTIKRTEDRIRSLEEEKSELLRRFENITGLEWEGVADIPYPLFPDILSYTSSSSVEESRLYAEIAKEEYLLESSRQKPRRLMVGGTIAGDIYTGAGLGLNSAVNDRDRISALGEIGWEGKSWSFGLSGGGSWDDDYTFTPQVTLSGSWQSNSSSESDELTLRALRTDTEMRERGYLDALLSFETESAELWNRLLAWKRDFSELQADIDYRSALLENTKLRFERGLATEEDMHDAALELELLSIDRSVLLLEGLSLECEIEMHIL